MAYIFDKNDVYRFAESLGIGTHDKGKEIWFDECPYCHTKEKEKFSVNAENGACKCFKASCAMGDGSHFFVMAKDFNFSLGDDEIKHYRLLQQPDHIETTGKAVEKLISERGIPLEIAQKYEVTTNKHNQNILCFPFYDDNGILQSVKYRNMAYKKGVSPEPKEWFEKDTMPILYGMKQATAFDKPLIVTEGQIDALSVAAAGFENACSVPNGATAMKFANNCADFIEKFPEIIIFGDNEGGKVTLVDNFKVRFPSMTIKCVRRENYLHQKDANDIWRLPNIGKSQICKCIADAEVVKRPPIKKLSEASVVDMNTIPHIRTGFYNIDKAIVGMSEGSLVVLTGYRGQGKSTFLSQMIANVLDDGKTVLAYSGELPDFAFRNWLDFQLAGPDNLVSTYDELFEELRYSVRPEVSKKIGEWYDCRMYIVDNTETSMSVEEIIEEGIRKYHADFICIDNVMTAMEGLGTNGDLNREQSDFVQRLKKMAVKYKVVILLVAHPRKTGTVKDPNARLTADDISGSGDITNRADIVITFQRDKTAENVNIIEIIKNRNNGKLLEGDKCVKLNYDPQTRRLFDSDAYGKRKSVNWRCGWEDSTEIDEFEQAIEDLPF